MEKQEIALGISKSQRRKLRKVEKKKKGLKLFRREQLLSAHKDLYSDSDHCLKKGNWCDKKQACDVLGQCIITLQRVQERPELLECLRGPKTIKEVIRLLAQHDPEPMKSFYPKKK